MSFPAEDRRKNPPVLTDAQLDLIRQETEHAVRKATRYVLRRAAVGYLTLLLGIGFVQYDNSRRADDARQSIVDSGQLISVDGCNRDFRTIEAVRGVLEGANASQQQSVQRGDISQAQAQRAHDFYAKHLTALVLPDCRRAQTILTDDPDAQIRRPTALYPNGSHVEGPRSLSPDKK